ncbi:hypothetical protein [Winogradskyella sp. 3972H.M.0a.05]|uniref:hypothetical protein n=1 Tax=Winogradskyella sp. 3972H.M.0a.05 TaxID=2950277 RepID=UPI003398C6D6
MNLFKSRVLLTVLICCAFNYSQSQKIINQNNHWIQGERLDLKTEGRDGEKAIGSPYLNANFQPARILVNGQPPSVIPNVRYNAHLDEIELKHTDGKVYFLNKNIDSIKVAFVNEKKTYMLFSPKNDGVKGFYVFLTTNDKVNLLKKESIRLDKGTAEGNGYSSPKPPSYKNNKDEYFIVSSDGLFKKLPRKKKEITNSLFPQYSKEITGFIKENKLKLSREADMIKLIGFFNTLQ